MLDSMRTLAWKALGAESVRDLGLETRSVWSERRYWLSTEAVRASGVYQMTIYAPCGQTTAMLEEASAASNAVDGVTISVRVGFPSQVFRPRLLTKRVLGSDAGC